MFNGLTDIGGATNTAVKEFPDSTGTYSITVNHYNILDTSRLTGKFGMLAGRQRNLNPFTVDIIKGSLTTPSTSGSGSPVR